jgi:hypothetical protein
MHTQGDSLSMLTPISSSIKDLFKIWFENSHDLDINLLIFIIYKCGPNKITNYRFNITCYYNIFYIFIISLVNTTILIISIKKKLLV